MTERARVIRSNIIEALVVGAPLYCAWYWKAAVVLHLMALVVWLFLKLIFWAWNNDEVALAALILTVMASVVGWNLQCRPVGQQRPFTLPTLQDAVPQRH